jgi:predicted PurR-regulated permease PerM
LYFSGLGLYLQGQQIVIDLPSYGARISDIVDSVATRMERVENGIYRNVVPRRFQPQSETTPAAPPVAPARGRQKKAETPIILPPILPPAVQEVHIQQEPTPIFVYAYTYLAEYYSVLLMASFVPFLVYFLLSWRDHIRARYLLIFEGENRQAAAATWAGMGDMVRAYVIGNFLLGLLLSVASGLLFASVKLPYWLIIAPMSGFLSLIPYIGLPLALLPPVVAALPVSKEPAMYLFLTVSVAMLHLLALNLLYPKFVGARVHLNPLAVTVALMFWGMLWGALGLVLAIPLTAGIKALCDHVPSMQPYGRLLGD